MLKTIQVRNDVIKVKQKRCKDNKKKYQIRKISISKHICFLSKRKAQKRFLIGFFLATWDSFLISPCNFF